MPKHNATAEIYGKALMRLRKRKGLTQVAAARLIDAEQATWGRYEAASNQAFMNIAVQKKCIDALGFTMDDFAREIDDVTHDRPMFGHGEGGGQESGSPSSPRAAMIFPLDGVVRGSSVSVAVHDDDEMEEYDFAPLLGKNTRVLRVVGDSMLPLVEPGGFVTYNKKGVPKRNSLAVIRLNDGQYFIKKFVRMTQTRVECIEMESREIDGAVAYVERPIFYMVGDVYAVYPAGMRID